MSRIVCVLAAKSVSKRIPGKNMRKLNGMPLVWYALNAALHCDSFDKVYMLTDSNKIGNFAVKCGATYLVDWWARKHPEGRGGWKMIAPLLDRLKLKKNDMLFFIQPTNPFITPEDLNRMLTLLVANKCDSVVSVRKVNDHPNWVYRKNHKYITRIADNRLVWKSQDLEELYVLNGTLYVASAEKLRQNRGFFGKDVIPYVMSKERSVEIDEPLDFAFAEFLLKNKKN